MRNCWWYTGVHQCSSHIRISYCTALRFVRRPYCCVDEQQPAKNERGQNSAQNNWTSCLSELQLLGARVSFSGSVSNLGVIIDSQLSMSDLVSSLCRACFFQLCQLRQVRSSLTTDTTKTLVHAFFSSRLDYYNSLLYGVNDGLLRTIQAVQNAAACVTTETRKFDHVRPVLRELHWLPVRKRIVDCVPVTSVASRRHLRSAVSGCLVVTWTNTSLGTRIFAVAGAKIWNSLLFHLRTQIFGQKLKRYFFMCHEHIWGFFYFCAIGLQMFSLLLLLLLLLFADTNSYV